MSEPIISAKNVGKKFAKSLKRSMLYGMTDVIKNAFGIPCASETLRAGEFWALQDVSFELKKGETLGIIGPNGSGKSTLLKMLNGIYLPDQGSIELQGRVGALIEVGAGFHPMLSGRENIYINGAILGMTKKEIDEKFDDIVTFADIGDFIDAPVKNYSSGMYVRLGFAIAINVNPEILLIDEILSVGDLSFQNKSLRKLGELRDKAYAVVFVSHNLKHVESICDKVIILNHGIKEFEGPAEEGVRSYKHLVQKKRVDALEKEGGFHTYGHVSTGDVELIDSGIVDETGDRIEDVAMGSDINIYFDFNVKKDVGEVVFKVGVLDENRMNCILYHNPANSNFSSLSKNRYRLCVKYSGVNLAPGVYFLSLAIRNKRTGETYERFVSFNPFMISGDASTMGLIEVGSEWSLNQIKEE